MVLYEAGIKFHSLGAVNLHDLNRRLLCWPLEALKRRFLLGRNYRFYVQSVLWYGLVRDHHLQLWKRADYFCEALVHKWW